MAIWLKYDTEKSCYVPVRNQTEGPLFPEVRGIRQIEGTTPYQVEVLTEDAFIYVITARRMSRMIFGHLAVRPEQMIQKKKGPRLPWRIEEMYRGQVLFAQKNTPFALPDHTKAAIIPAAFGKMYVNELAKTLGYPFALETLKTSQQNVRGGSLSRYEKGKLAFEEWEISGIVSYRVRTDVPQACFVVGGAGELTSESAEPRSLNEYSAFLLLPHEAVKIGGDLRLLTVPFEK